jgi:hypothetical protein
MPTFDFVAWGNTKQVGRWVLEDGTSGVYRGQCTQTVTQLLRDLGYTGWNRARGNGSQVGATMVSLGEATYVGTNLTSIPSGEIHIVCQEVGTGNAGHVSVAASGDTIFEENVTITGLLTRNYGIGPTYPGRIGRLGESFRMTRYHYKLTVDTAFDGVGDSSGGDPTTDPIGPNQNRFLRKNLVDIQKSKTLINNSVKNHKKFQLVPYKIKGIGQSA